MKNIKNVSKRIFAMLMVLAMLLCVAVGILLNPAYADEDDSYSFTTGQLDPEFYAKMYPDVASSVSNDPYALFMHYCDYGMAEGRIPYAGAQPGEAINGYIGINTSVAATATVVDQSGTTATADDEYDLSDWTPEQMALLAQKQAEFDASGLVHKGWTEAQVYDRLKWIQENLYPEGTKVGICQLGAGKIGIALYGDDMYWSAGYDKNGRMVLPKGFVNSETKSRVNGEGNIRDVRVGDTIYTVGSGAGHVQIVLSCDEKGITVVESNQNSDEKMHWGRKISWDELENGGNTIFSKANKWTKIRYRKY